MFFETGIPEAMNDLFFDPQTSGGLLYAVSPKDADGSLDALQKANPGTTCAVIGEVVPLSAHHVHVLF